MRDSAEPRRRHCPADGLIGDFFAWFKQKTGLPGQAWALVTLVFLAGIFRGWSPSALADYLDVIRQAVLLLVAANIAWIVITSFGPRSRR